jgi:hypothetical protein
MVAEPHRGRLLGSQTLTRSTWTEALQLGGAGQHRDRAGRYFTDIEDQHRSTVAVIGRRCEDQPLSGRRSHRQGDSRSKAGRSRWWEWPKPRAACSANRRTRFVDIPGETYFQIYGSRKGIRYAAKAPSDQKVLEQAKDEMRMLIRAAGMSSRAGRHLLGHSPPTRWSAPLDQLHQRHRGHGRRHRFHLSWWWAAW